MRAGRSSGHPPFPAPQLMLSRAGWKALLLPWMCLSLDFALSRWLECVMVLVGCAGARAKRPGSSLGASGQGSLLAGGPPGVTELVGEKI